MKTHIVQQENINYDVISIATLILKLQETGWGLSMMRIKYKLTNITTKTQKLKTEFEKK